MGSLHRFDQLLELPKQSHPDHSASTKQKASLPTGAFVHLPLSITGCSLRSRSGNSGASIIVAKKRCAERGTATHGPFFRDGPHLLPYTPTKVAFRARASLYSIVQVW